jgi:predicted nucleotide-binding protein
MFAWAQNGEWPFYQYVADEVEGQGISDAARVLSSFPTLGTRDNVGRSYCDVIYDHTYPAPRDDSQVSLSVGGLSRHEAGIEMAQGFVAVLKYAAEKYVRTPTDPTKIVEVEVSSEELAGLKSHWWPPHVLHATGLLLKSEWAQGVQYLGGPTDSREWRIRVGRGIRRYHGLTLDKYLELIRADIDEAEAANSKYQAPQFTDQRGWTALIEDGPNDPVFSSVTSEEPEMPYGSTTSADRRNTIFVVHGHDDGLKASVARLLERATSAEVVILHEQADKGQTVIEKFESHAQPATFAVVLLTPDDEGRKNGVDDWSARARQNVILEHGYFIGRLGRSRVVALYKGKVELPSDLSGLIYKAVDDAGAWKWELAKELRAADIDVDMNEIV